jgi:hypothetical protein
MNSHDLLTVTDGLESRIRADITEWLVVSNASSSHVVLHLPTDDGPLCGRTVAKRNPGSMTDVKYRQWKRKPVDVYPPGYKPICQYCATKWERGSDE